MRVEANPLVNSAISLPGGPAVSRPLRIEVAGQTDVGRKRAHNEDNFAIMAEYGLYVVADGMGGHASGEIASKMAVDTLHEFFTATADDPERTWQIGRASCRERVEVEVVGSGV